MSLSISRNPAPSVFPRRSDARAEITVHAGSSGSEAGWLKRRVELMHGLGMDWASAKERDRPDGTGALEGLQSDMLDGGSDLIMTRYASRRWLGGGGIG
jgi:hypothetical protein